MKVDYVAHGTLVDQSASPRKTKPTTPGFEQVFNETLQRHVGVEQGSSTVFQPLTVPACSLESSIPFNVASGVQAMEDMIDALEGYQQRLADPEYCLRDIAPSLERLETAHRHLARLAGETPCDSTLGNIMNEGLVTTTMEIHRFHSGVYC